MTLADRGADVVRIERTGIGGDVRISRAEAPESLLVEIGRVDPAGAVRQP